MGIKPKHDHFHLIIQYYLFTKFNTNNFIVSKKLINNRCFLETHRTQSHLPIILLQPIFFIIIVYLHLRTGCDRFYSLHSRQNYLNEKRKKYRS